MPAYTLIHLLHPVSFNTPSLIRCACGQVATRVKVYESFAARDGLWLTAQWQDVCCSVCQSPDDLVLRSRQALIMLHQAHIAFLAAYRESAAEHVQIIEQRALTSAGFILRLTGREGRLVELPDGSLQCHMADGRRLAPCCWATGAGWVDGRTTESQSRRHSPACLIHELELDYAV